MGNTSTSSTPSDTPVELDEVHVCADGAEQPDEAVEVAETVEVIELPFGQRQIVVMPDEAPPAAPHIQLFTTAHLDALIDTARASTTDGDIKSRNRTLAGYLRKSGIWRLLHRLPDDWELRLADVETDYPHFASFIAYVRSMCALAAVDDGVVELEWALLDGAPGTGKSTVVERLNGIIGGGYVRIPMAAVESGAHIGGSQEFWSNSKTGLVFTTLTEGTYANPILLLDEIDKVSADMRYDPLGPLYELLEPALAARFCDLSLPALPINASRIVWVSTANDASALPSAILQRFVVFQIPMPTVQQSLAVARSVLRTLQARHPRLQRFTLEAEAMEAMAGLAPREMKKRIHLACGQAARDGRVVVGAADFPAEAPSGPRMGF